MQQQRGVNMVRKTGTSKMEMHFGRALLKVVSEYPTLYTVLLELVQNGMDVGATFIQILVDQPNRTATVTDNGNGISIKGFDEALASVCLSSKVPGQMGQFGVGMVSPIGKCERFTFTSKPKNGKEPYISWNFVTEDILQEKDCPHIPFTERTDLCQGTRHAKKGQKSVQWSTEVHMKRVSKDHTINKVDADDLAEAIRERFGIPMLKRGIKVDLTVIDASGRRKNILVVAKDFEGVPLPEWKHVDKDSGTTTLLYLFLARKNQKGKKGTVFLRQEGNDFRVPFPQFTRSVTGFLEADILSALNSGVFEGEIITQAQLKVNRREFTENDALFALCCGIETWYREVGEKNFKNEKETKQEARFQEMGLRSMKVIEGILKEPGFAALLDVVQKFKKGTIGSGHAEIPEYKKKQTQDKKSLAVNGSTRNGNDGGNPERTSPASEHKKQIPLSVMGPKGRKRTIVQSNSLGIQFAYEKMGNVTRVYEWDVTCGVLTFNTNNILWSQCEDSDNKVMRFQEYVAIQVLTLLTIPEQWRVGAEKGYESLFRIYVYTLIYADKLAGRAPGKKPRKK